MDVSKQEERLLTWLSFFETNQITTDFKITLCLGKKVHYFPHQLCYSWFLQAFLQLWEEGKTSLDAPDFSLFLFPPAFLLCKTWDLSGAPWSHLGRIGSAGLGPYLWFTGPRFWGLCSSGNLGQLGVLMISRPLVADLACGFFQAWEAARKLTASLLWHHAQWQPCLPLFLHCADPAFPFSVITLSTCPLRLPPHGNCASLEEDNGEPLARGKSLGINVSCSFSLLCLEL